MKKLIDFSLKGANDFLTWILRLFRLPLFWYISFWLHAVIFASATAFYYVEKELNEFNFGFLSSYYWAISIATTTGNADIFPKTEVGMYIAILLMFLGSLFLWSYTALFAATLVLPVMRKVRKDVSSLGSEVREIEKEVSIDVKEIIALRKEIESLKKLLNKN